MSAPSAPTPSKYASRTNTHAPDWHWLVVWDILLNNLATGLFLVAALAELVRPAEFRSISAWAYALALIVLLADLLCLVLDLGDPLRFHHMLRVFKMTSPMSFGTWSLTAFSLPLTTIVMLEALTLVGLLPATAQWLTVSHKILVVAGIIPAFASAAYKGVLFSTNAQPGWRDARTFGAYLINSAIMLGAAELLIIAFTLDQPQPAQTCRIALIVLIFLNLVPSSLLLFELHPTLSRTYLQSSYFWITSAVLYTGFLFPLILLVITRGPITAAIAVISLVAASFAIRAVLVFLPHHVAHR